MDGTDCATQGSAAESWTYTYDGDGVRVKEVYAGTGTLTKYYFAGGAYEVQDDGTTTTIRVYYSITGMRVAMEEDDGTTQTVYYFVNDHLSSASVVTDASGTLLSENRYTPFGEVRDLPASMSTDDPITETDFGYTGQRDLGDIGLMDYNARFYSPLLGKFIQPDSLVPNPVSPQAWNRYSYVKNNPILFIDPAGHRYCDWDGGGCSEDGNGSGYGRDYDWDPRTWSYGGGGVELGDIDEHDLIDTERTLVELESLAGGDINMITLLSLTARAEYWLVCQKLVDRGRSGSYCEALGQEALGRSYYHFCGTDGCNRSELIRFLSGYQPFFGESGVIDIDPKEAALDIWNNISYDFANGASQSIYRLNNQMAEILDLDFASDPSRMWINGKVSNLPSQWYGPGPRRPNGTTLGNTCSDFAIEQIGYGNRIEFFYFVTYCQEPGFRIRLEGK